MSSNGLSWELSEGHVTLRSSQRNWLIQLLYLWKGTSFTIWRANARANKITLKARHLYDIEKRIQLGLWSNLGLWHEKQFITQVSSVAYWNLIRLFIFVFDCRNDYTNEWYQKPKHCSASLLKWAPKVCLFTKILNFKGIIIFHSCFAWWFF